MAIRAIVAGVSGWTGGEITRAILSCNEFELTGAIARRSAGRDVGELLGLPACGVAVAASLEEALARPADVLVDFTSPDSVKERTLAALARGGRGAGPGPALNGSDRHPDGLDSGGLPAHDGLQGEDDLRCDHDRVFRLMGPRPVAALATDRHLQHLHARQC